jgi:DNA-binding NtrC family response regulator
MPLPRRKRSVVSRRSSSTARSTGSTASRYERYVSRRHVAQGRCPAASATASSRKKIGVQRLEAAHGGTLFLHDVDALSLDLQGKVLAAIDSGSVRRLGGGDARPLDVRVIAATHADLADLVCRGMFRADLLDRFARSTLVLLPLRERPDDILPLARHFAARLAQRQGEVRRLTSDAEDQLKGYRWPGNVRELSAVIERAVMRRSREEIGVEELGLPSI